MEVSEERVMRALKIMDVFCCFVWKIRVIEY